MAGWSLSEGTCTNKTPSENELRNSLLNAITKSQKTTTYKFCFLKCILDYVCVSDNLIITYDEVFERFTSIYWVLITRYNISQIYKTASIKKSKVEMIIEDIIAKYNLPREASIDLLSPTIKSELLSSVKKLCSTNVIGAFFYSTNSLFYSFSNKTKEIELSAIARDYLREHCEEINSLNWKYWGIAIGKMNSIEMFYELDSTLEAIIKNNMTSRVSQYSFKQSSTGLESEGLKPSLHTSGPVSIEGIDVDLSQTDKKILELLESSHGLKAKDISNRLKLIKKNVNSALYGRLSKYCIQDSSYKWYIISDFNKDQEINISNQDNEKRDYSRIELENILPWSFD